MPQSSFQMDTTHNRRRKKVHRTQMNSGASGSSSAVAGGSYSVPAWAATTWPAFASRKDTTQQQEEETAATAVRRLLAPLRRIFVEVAKHGVVTDRVTLWERRLSEDSDADDEDEEGEKPAVSFALIGKDARRCAVVAEHPSVSKVHGVFQLGFSPALEAQFVERMVTKPQVAARKGAEGNKQAPVGLHEVLLGTAAAGWRKPLSSGGDERVEEKNASAAAQALAELCDEAEEEEEQEEKEQHVATEAGRQEDEACLVFFSDAGSSNGSVVTGHYKGLPQRARVPPRSCWVPMHRDTLRLQLGASDREYTVRYETREQHAAEAQRQQEASGWQKKKNKKPAEEGEGSIAAQEVSLRFSKAVSSTGQQHDSQPQHVSKRGRNNDSDDGNDDGILRRGRHNAANASYSRLDDDDIDDDVATAAAPNDGSNANATLETTTSVVDYVPEDD